MWPKKWIFFSIIFSFSASLFIFQNCAPPSSGFGTMNQGSLDLPDEEDPVDPPNKVEKAEVSAQNANKVLTSNILLSVFGPTAKNIIMTYISNNTADFGAANSIYDRNIKADCTTNSAPGVVCSTSTPLALQTSSNVGLNIRREGWRLQACHEITKRTDALRAAFQKINTNQSTATPQVTAVTVNKAFSLFYIGKITPPGAVTDSLRIIAQDESATIEQWRDILLTLCLSPHWQVL